MACIILTHFSDRLLHYPAFSVFSLSPNKATEMPLKDNKQNATPEASWPSEKCPLGRGQPAVCSVHAPVRPGCVPVPKPSDRSRRLCKRETRRVRVFANAPCSCVALRTLCGGFFAPHLSDESWKCVARPGVELSSALLRGGLGTRVCAIEK